LFGGAQTPAGAPAGQQSKPTSNLFGGGNNGASTPGTATGGGLFQGMGSKDASSTTPQANKTAPPSSLSFTPAGNPPSGNLFGGGAAAAKPASSLFSQPPKASENKAPASGVGDAQPKPSFGFGNANPSTQRNPSPVHQRSRRLRNRPRRRNLVVCSVVLSARSQRQVPQHQHLALRQTSSEVLVLLHHLHLSLLHPQPLLVHLQVLVSSEVHRPPLPNLPKSRQLTSRPALVEHLCSATPQLSSQQASKLHNPHSPHRDLQANLLTKF
jgi:hypothetical protein